MDVEVTVLSDKDVDLHEEDVKDWGADSEGNIQEMTYRFMCSFLSASELHRIKKADKKILGDQ